MTWIFGYGSLVWRPGFAAAESVPGTVRGFKRRFWQASTDHRGTPEQPGRVVTLLEEKAEVCVGVAHRIPSAIAEKTLAALDDREKGGYERRRVEVRPLAPGRRPIEDVWLYVATPENPNYWGPASVEEIATTAAEAVGPSGPNREYVLKLASALREVGADDAHVFEIEARLLELLGR